MCNLLFVPESVDIASFVCLDDVDLIIEKLKVKANDIFLCVNENTKKMSSTALQLSRKDIFLLGERKYKIVKVKGCLGSPLTVNCLLLSMYIQSVIKQVKSLIIWFYEL